MSEPVQQPAGDIPIMDMPVPRIRTVGTDRPWAWLGAGWSDILKAPHISVGYGSIAVAASYILVAGLGSLGLEYLILPMAAGFMLVGPILAAGLYEVSRRQELGQPVTLEAAFTAYGHNAAQLVAIGFILMLALLAWARIAMIIFAMFFSDVPPTLELMPFVEQVFFSDRTFPFLLAGTAVGFVLAVIVFSISAISIPMLLDRDVGVITAIITSVAVVRQNFQTMVAWAGLIVLFTAAGIATAFFGLVVAFPLIGHATWHAYRDVVVRDTETSGEQAAQTT